MSSKYNTDKQIIQTSKYNLNQTGYEVDWTQEVPDNV